MDVFNDHTVPPDNAPRMASQLAMALAVCGFEPVGQPDPILGLPRYFRPRDGFDFHVFGPWSSLGPS